MELNRNENADEGEDGEPYERPPCPGFDEWFIDQLNVEGRFLHVASSSSSSKVNDMPAEVITEHDKLSFGNAQTLSIPY